MASVDTIYPFSDTLTTTINAEKAFTYYVRIPSWVTNGTININEGGTQALSPKNGLQAIQLGAGATKFVLNLPAEITTGEINISMIPTLQHAVLRVPPPWVDCCASWSPTLCFRYREESNCPCPQLAGKPGSRFTIRSNKQLEIRHRSDNTEISPYLTAL